jgi:hypothetical protein
MSVTLAEKRVVYYGQPTNTSQKNSKMYIIPNKTQELTSYVTHRVE